MKRLADKKIQEEIGWSPYHPKKHKPQIDILNSKARDKAVCAGRRGGKSAEVAYETLKELLKDDKHIWIVAPNYDLTLKVFNYVQNWIIKGFSNLAPQISSRIPPRIDIPQWHSWLECKSAENPTSLLGEELDLLVVDEAARIKRNVYQTYLYPTTASRKGKRRFLSTPFGKGWFYEEYLRCKEAEDGEAFHFTSLDNPYFPKEEWENAKKNLPEQVFKQEYLALFLDDAASVFRGIRDITGDTLKDAEMGHFYTMGVDLGRHEDFTVITVIDRFENNVVYWDRFKEIDFPLQKARIKGIAKRYNNARIVIDSTGLGDPIAEDLRHAGLLVDDFKFSRQSKAQLIKKLAILIEQRLITIPHNEVLIDELESFGYNITESRNITYSAPEGGHDDAVYSLALAVWGLTGRQDRITPIQKALKERAEHKTTSYI